MWTKAKDPTFQSVSDLKTKPDEEERDWGQLARATLKVAYGGEVFVKDGPELFYCFPLSDCFLLAQEACTQKLVQQSFGLCNK